MKYKPGDRVLIVEKPTVFMNPKAHHWFGKIMTIKCITKYYYYMEEDNFEYIDDGKTGHSGWYWSDNEIIGLAYQEVE